MKYLLVFSEEDKSKLIKQGYKFINSLKQKDLTIYQFEDNKKLNFDKSIKLFQYSSLMLF